MGEIHMMFCFYFITNMLLSQDTITLDQDSCTIVFTEGNTLTVEVSYDKTNDSISLVKGHYWKFDGKVAWKGVPERWLTENREWMGSNFFDVLSVDVKFKI